MQREARELGVLGVERGGAARFVRGDAAAREVVFDLRLDRAERLGGGGGRVVQRLGDIRLAGGEPRNAVVDGLHHLVGFRLVDARLAAAIGDRAHTRDRVFDQLLELGVVGRFWNYDAIAIELRLGKRLRDRIRIGDGDQLGVGFAEFLEHPLRRRDDLVVLEIAEVDLVRALQDVVRILEHGPDEHDLALDIVDADPAILVGIDQVERLDIEIDALDRHRERNP